MRIGPVFALGLFLAPLSHQQYAVRRCCPEHLRNAVARLDSALPAVSSAQDSAQEVVSGEVLLQK